MPAQHKGSNFSTFASAGIGWGGSVLEANGVTTRDGKYQLFLTHGEGVVSPGFSAGWTQGVIEGDFETPEDFRGNAAQISGGGNLPFIPV